MVFGWLFEGFYALFKVCSINDFLFEMRGILAHQGLIVENFERVQKASREKAGLYF
jgi:hypothetical protein